MLEWTIHGMGESEKLIASTEEKLGIQFPAGHRAMLKEHSGGESEELEIMLMTDEILPMTEFPEFTCLTRWSRDDLAMVFPIFQSLSGNYYALDYSQGGEPGVLEIDKHLDENETIPRYESFDTFIADIERQAEQAREEERLKRPAFGR